MPGFDLMERAGRSAFDALLDRWPQRARSSASWCGKGNNAAMLYRGRLTHTGKIGDARAALPACADADALTGDAGKARDWALRRGCKSKS